MSGYRKRPQSDVAVSLHVCQGHMVQRQPQYQQTQRAHGELKRHRRNNLQDITTTFNTMSLILKRTFFSFRVVLPVPSPVLLLLLSLRHVFTLIKERRATVLPFYAAVRRFHFCFDLPRCEGKATSGRRAG